MPQGKQKSPYGGALTVLAIGAIAYGAYSIWKGPPPKHYPCDEGDVNPAFSIPDVAAEIYVILSGADLPEVGHTERSELFTRIGDLRDNTLRCLSNYWLNNFDTECSLYTWIEDEVVIPWSEEDYAQEYALERLLEAGVEPSAGDCIF